MKQYGVQLCEQETTLNIYPNKFDEWSEFYSSIPADIRRFRKYAEMDPEHVIIEKENSIGIFGKVHNSWVVGIRPPRRRKEMSETQKQEARERLIAARSAKTPGNPE